MTTKHLGAQISLLDDPDPKIYQFVKDSIVSNGENAISELEAAKVYAQESIVHYRIEDIIHEINFSEIFKEIEFWTKTNDKSWFSILFLISKFYNQDIDKESLLKQLNIIKNDIWIELNDDLTALEKIKVFNKIFYDKYAFGKYKTEVQYISSFFLSELLNTKKGNDQSLALLYLVLAELLDLPIQAVDLPMNMILAYQADERTLAIDEFEKQILFYINPINKGIVFGADIIDAFVKKNNLEKEFTYYNPTSKLSLLIRYIDEIIYAIKPSQNTQQVEDLTKLKTLVLESNL